VKSLAAVNGCSQSGHTHAKTHGTYKNVRQ